jgi:hypothetical protein
MAGSVQNPGLQNRSTVFIRLNRAGVTHPSRCLTAGDGDPKIRRSLRLSNDLIAIDRVATGVVFLRKLLFPGSNCLAIFPTRQALS